MCKAPAFHHGPRPLVAERHARLSLILECLRSSDERLDAAGTVWVLDAASLGLPVFLPLAVCAKVDDFAVATPYL